VRHVGFERHRSRYISHHHVVQGLDERPVHAPL
jgi:hypothetical protein